MIQTIRPNFILNSILLLLFFFFNDLFNFLDYYIDFSRILFLWFLIIFYYWYWWPLIFNFVSFILFFWLLFLLWFFLFLRLLLFLRFFWCFFFFFILFSIFLSNNLMDGINSRNNLLIIWINQISIGPMIQAIRPYFIFNWIHLVFFNLFHFHFYLLDLLANFLRCFFFVDLLFIFFRNWCVVRNLIVILFVLLRVNLSFRGLRLSFGKGLVVLAVFCLFL